MSHHVLRALPFASRIAGRHARDIVALDKARAQKLLAGINPHGPLGGGQSFAAARKRRHHHPHKPTTPGGGTGGGNHDGGETSKDGVDVTDAGVTYTASVGVGNPPTNYTLLIDTGKPSGRTSCLNTYPPYREFQHLDWS